jgi:phospholipase/lecithinase/hemolysin
MDPAAVVSNIQKAIGDLYRLGARDIVVFDLPDLGLVPGNGGDPAATAVSKAHNALLHDAIARLRAAYPRLRLILVELDPLFNDLRTRMEPFAPALAVFAPTDPGLVACLFVDPATCTDAPPMLFNTDFGFLFWDVVHPTTEAHKYLADYIYDQLASEYE